MLYANGSAKREGAREVWFCVRVLRSYAVAVVQQPRRLLQPPRLHRLNRHPLAATVAVVSGDDETGKPESKTANASEPGTGKPPLHSRWNNTSYNNTLSEVGAKQWLEIDNATKKVNFHFTEVERNSRFVQLKRAETGGYGQDYRVYADHMDFKKDEKWGWCSNGHWSDGTHLSSKRAGSKAKAGQIDKPVAQASAKSCDEFKADVMQCRHETFTKADFYAKFGKPTSLQDIVPHFGGYGPTSNPGAAIQQALLNRASVVLTYNLSDGVVEVSAIVVTGGWRISAAEQVQ